MRAVSSRLWILNERKRHETLNRCSSSRVRDGSFERLKRDATQVRLLADQEEDFNVLLYEDRRRQALLHAGEETGRLLLL